MPLIGHYWTLRPRFVRQPSAPLATDWSLRVADPLRGEVRLSGRLRHEARAHGLLLVLHGIAGSAGAPYVQTAARAAAAAGLSCLRLNLRGCDHQGEDFYHAGLTCDLVAVLAAPELAAYSRIFILGYSIGGHLALRYAAGVPDPRLAAVAAVCPPLDLSASAAYFDRVSWIYRRHILRGLWQIYRLVAARRPVAVAPEEAATIGSLWEWDDRITAPRWGFGDATSYYSQASVAPLLGRLAVPALLIAGDRDPVLPPRLLRPALAAAGALLDVHFIARGGHVGFAPDLDLGEAAAPGLEPQLLAWLDRQPPPLTSASVASQLTLSPTAIWPPSITSANEPPRQSD